jgi:hypothetical protein
MVAISAGLEGVFFCEEYRFRTAVLRRLPATKERSLMVRHIYLWNVADGADGDAASALLNKLPTRIDFIRGWKLGPHIGDSGIERQYALVCDFDSIDHVRAYLTHPYHDEIVAQFAPMACDHVAVDIELD